MRVQTKWDGYTLEITAHDHAMEAIVTRRVHQSCEFSIPFALRVRFNLWRLKKDYAVIVNARDAG